MICLNCKKQIPDDSQKCPFCGNEISHKEQLKKEISFRRYQRWIFYALISLLILGMIGIIVKIYNTNNKLLLSISGIQTELKTAQNDLNVTEEELNQTQNTLTQKNQQMENLQKSLTAKEEELNKKLEEFKSITDEKTDINEQYEQCQLDLDLSDANIYSLIIKLGEAISNEDLNKIALAESNLEGDDTDNDGLSDAIEIALATNTERADTDGDGYDDKSEIIAGFNPNGEGALDINNDFANNYKGKILLQVENNGEAWYIGTADGKRYFLGNPADAFRIMRDLEYWTKDWQE